VKQFAGVLEEFVGKAVADALKKALGEKFDLEVETKVQEGGPEGGEEQGFGTVGPGQEQGGGEGKTGGPVVPNKDDTDSTDNTNHKRSCPQGRGEGDSSENKDGRKEEEKKKKGFWDNIKATLKDPRKTLAISQKAIHASANMLNTGIKKGFSIVEEIYARMKSASPLLQAIESMFNLAMNLFFMPLGNKLAEVMIPAVLKLVDEVVAIWESFEGKTLGEMFAFAIDNGVRILSGYFNEIGKTLIDQGGLVGKIGLLLESIGGFIENSGVQLLTSILNISTTMLANLKHFISLWISLKMAEIAIQASGLWGDLTGVKPLIALGAVLAVGGTAFAASEAGLSAIGLAEGGYVPAKPGGQLAVIAEGGEGEYVVPESKKEAFIKYHGAQITDTAYRDSEGGTTSRITSSVPREYESMFGMRSQDAVSRVNQSRYEFQNNSDSTKSESNVQNINITYHINGYTDSELRSIIRETVDEQVAKAVYRS
jgi:hypothetical protein